MLRQGLSVELFSTSVEGTPPPALEQLRLHSLPRPPKGDAAQREQAALSGNDSLYQKLKESGAFDLVYERYSLWSYAAMAFARERRFVNIWKARTHSAIAKRFRFDRT